MRLALPLTLLLAGCPSEAPELVAPTSPTITVAPAAPRTGDDLVLSITPPSGNPDSVAGYDVVWRRDGVDVSAVAGAMRVPAATTAKGEAWSVWVTATGDGGLESAPAFFEVVIGNTPPTPPSIAVTPEAPIAGTSLQCLVVEEGLDPDDDALTYVIEWSIAGAAFDGATTTDLDGDTVPGDQVAAGHSWTCSVAASDGTDASAAVVATVGVGEASTAVADFSLPDVNETSATFGTPVSPRDYLQKVSGWYFGHST